jgi:hypothetical protein
MTWVMRRWHGYWFAPAPYVDLAVLRVTAVALQLFWMTIFLSAPDLIGERAALADEYFQPLPLLNLLNLPFGWGFRPDAAAVEIVYRVGVAAGLTSLVGLFTNLSLIVFTFCCVYVQAYVYSFGDFHHPEAVMMIALAVLAISPCGRVLSADWLLRRRQAEDLADVLDVRGRFAGWPIRVIQWFFVLMYLSAITMKIGSAAGGGLEWANGFTLQYYLLQDGLRWDSPLALWLAQHHTLVYLLQNGVVLFQATFVLAVLFPKLRWIYVPAGLAMHTGIYLTMTSPFFQWIALYAVFIPWATLGKRLLSSRLPAEEASARPG